jgi:hypothetical protein
VFKVITDNQYKLELDDYTLYSEAWVATSKHPDLAWLSGNNLTSTYREDRLPEYADITLLIERISIDLNYTAYATGINTSLYLPKVEFPTTVRTSSNNTWAHALTSEGYVVSTALDSHWADTLEPLAFNGTLWFKILGGFGRVGPRNSKIQMSLVFLLIVISANAVKVACFLVMLLRGVDEVGDPLVTIGDAIASFLAEPDESTKNHCSWSQTEYLWETGRIKRTRAREEDGLAAKLDRRCDGIWEKRRCQYGSALSESKRMLLTVM